MLEFFFNKFAGFQACGFIKKRLQQRNFPVKIANSFFIEKPVVAASGVHGWSKGNIGKKRVKVTNFFFFVENVLFQYKLCFS